jgi:hypothetical protein
VSLSHNLQQQQVEDDSCGDLLDTSTESGHLLDISADSLMVTGGSGSRAAAAAGGLDNSFDRDSIAGSEPDNQESSHTSPSGQFWAPNGTCLLRLDDILQSSKKVLISRAQPPPTCPRNESARIKNITYGDV